MKVRTRVTLSKDSEDKMTTWHTGELLESQTSWIESVEKRGTARYG